ncbi:MAG: ATP-binding protein [Chlamydiia bacterium]|nr:ATP-binding protein [Chlamydiia bacterium]
MRIWNQFLSEIETHIGKQASSQWLAPLKLSHFDAANIYLEAQDSFQIHWFEEHILPRLKQKPLLNENGRSVRVHLSLQGGIKHKSSAPALPPPLVVPDSLDPEMALSYFLPTPQNQMALQILHELEKHPGSLPPFNPIFLYGAKQSGKTHLLMASALLLQKAGKKVFYVNAKTFTEQVVAAIRQDFMQSFRAAYRAADALLVDDIQIFAKKTATQEEFFHTFNALHTLGRPILLSANLAPSKLTEIEARLISRFEWGITLKIEPTDPLSILTQKTKVWNFPLDPRLLAFLADQFPLEPCLALQALALRSNKPETQTPESIKILLKDLLQKQIFDKRTPESIVKQVAAHYGIRATDITGTSQAKESALPRKIAMYTCREILKLPFQKIGEFFGRDHSTVMASVRFIQTQIAEGVASVIEAVEAVK